ENCRFSQAEFLERREREQTGKRIDERVVKVRIVDRLRRMRTEVVERLQHGQPRVGPLAHMHELQKVGLDSARIVEPCNAAQCPLNDVGQEKTDDNEEQKPHTVRARPGVARRSGSHWCHYNNPLTIHCLHSPMLVKCRALWSGSTAAQPTTISIANVTTPTRSLRHCATGAALRRSGSSRTLAPVQECSPTCFSRMAIA